MEAAPTFVGAATEPPRAKSPEWIRTYWQDRFTVRVACMRCVESDTVHVAGQIVGWVTSQLGLFERKHSACETGRRSA